MSRKHRELGTGLVSLGAFMVGVTLTTAEAQADPTPGSEFKIRVQAVIGVLGRGETDAWINEGEREEQETWSVHFSCVPVDVMAASSSQVFPGAAPELQRNRLA